MPTSKSNHIVNFLLPKATMLCHQLEMVMLNDYMNSHAQILCVDEVVVL